MRLYTLLPMMLIVLVFAGCTTTPPIIPVNEGPTFTPPNLPSTTNENNEQVEEQKSSGEKTSNNVVEISMTAKQWNFVPDTITVNEGDTVKLSIYSVDVAHGIGLPDFGISEYLSPGNTVNIEFVADKKGTFTFFCNVSCGAGHRSMRGQLIVK